MSSARRRREPPRSLKGPHASDMVPTSATLGASPAVRARYELVRALLAQVGRAAYVEPPRARCLAR